MKAVIIAGGLGKRLKPITGEVPKALVKIRGRPLIEHVIDRLKASGITEIIICTGYLSEVIENYLGNGERFGVNIKYSKETSELGTGGALKNAQKLIGNETFLVLYGDIIVEMDLQKLIDFHKSKNSEATLVIHETDHPYDSDMVDVDEKKKVTLIFRLKPGEAPHGYGNSTVYCFEPSIFRFFPEGKSHLDKEILPAALKKSCQAYGYITAEPIKDIGTPERYKKYA